MSYKNQFRYTASRVNELASLAGQVASMGGNLEREFQAIQQHIEQISGDVTILTSGGGGGGGGGSPLSHNLLSATHPDTLPASPVQGDLVYANYYPQWARLAGNITATKQFLTQTGTGVVSADPAWAAIVDADIPATLVRTSRTLTVAGTASRISVTGGTQDLSANRTWTVDIDAAYVGQTSITTLGTIGTGVWNGTAVGVQYGGTGANLSATGGAGQYVKQSSVGAAFTVGTIPASDIASGAALTKADDTNVTLTLGGSPSTALLAATSLTLGWTGTLARTRGGTGTGAATTNGQLLIGNTGTGDWSVATLTAGANVTITNGAGTITIASTGGGGSPGGADTNIQYNNSGAFAGDNNLNWDYTNLRLGIGTLAPRTKQEILFGTSSGMAFPYEAFAIERDSDLKLGLAMTNTDLANNGISVAYIFTGDPDNDGYFFGYEVQAIGNLDPASNYMRWNYEQRDTTAGTVVAAVTDILKVWSNGLVEIDATNAGTSISPSAQLRVTGITASNYVKTDGSSLLVGVSSIPASDISSGQALTKVNDTNVTLSLGGTPATALLAATSLTLGWTGQLSVSRGGIGVGTLASNGVLYGNGTGAVLALAVNATGTNKFLTQVSSGAPAWNTIATSDLPNNGANPTASVGLSTVNGSATTWMRSDGAPALSQSIAPTWTGVHIHNPAARSSGVAPYHRIITPADTGITANTEGIGIAFGGTSANPPATVTRTFANGTITQQREFEFTGPTYDFTSSGTITDAATVSITEAPIAASGTTITRAHTLWIRGDSTPPILTIDALGSSNTASLRLNSVSANEVNFYINNSRKAYVGYDGTLNIATSVNTSIILNTNGTDRISISGTGATTLTAVGSHGLLYTDGSSVLTKINHVAAGQLLLSAGTTTVPAWNNNINIDTNGKVTKYNGISTVASGVPSMVAQVNLTGQSATIAATTFYTTPAAAGLYVIMWTATITTAATTSSTLGGTNGFQITYTNADDSTVVTTPRPDAPSAGTNRAYGQKNQSNTVGTQISGSIVVYAKASTNIQYGIEYTSSGGTAMVYSLHVSLLAL